MAADFVFSATSVLPFALVAQVHLILAGRILRIDRRDLRIAALQGDFKREGGAVAVSTGCSDLRSEHHYGADFLSWIVAHTL